MGRSYNKGKTLDALLEELKAESGTRYAPYVVALLQQEDVRRDIDRLLTEGREDVYRETFTLLRRLKNG